MSLNLVRTARSRRTAAFFGQYARRCAAIICSAAIFGTSASAGASLIHYYPFTNGVTDEAGTVNGTLIGNARVTGRQLSLNGVTAYVQFPSKIVPTSGSYSVALIGRRTAATGNRFFELISQGFSDGPGFYIGATPDYYIRATDIWGTGVYFPFNYEEYFHFALVVDAVADQSKFYVNGAMVATRVGAIVTTNGGTNTRLGKQFDCCAEYFPGNIDEVRIYDHPLSEEEVQALAVHCRTDFDGDGFLTGLDFDLFVQAFESGEKNAADFNSDGFITGQDFDEFVTVFQQGC